MIEIFVYHAMVCKNFIILEFHSQNKNIHWWYSVMKTKCMKTFESKFSCPLLFVACLTVLKIEWAWKLNFVLKWELTLQFHTTYNYLKFISCPNNVKKGVEAEWGVPALGFSAIMCMCNMYIGELSNYKLHHCCMSRWIFIIICTVVLSRHSSVASDAVSY